MASVRKLRERVPLPTAWELWELLIHAYVLPFVFLPRAVGFAGCRLFARFLMRSGSRYRASLQAVLPPEVLRANGNDAARVLREFETRMLYERVLTLRGALFPFWRRRVRLTGTEHVRAGLEAGHGVILWVQPCLASTVAVKVALFEAGYPLAHLTRPGHGFSSRPFGLHVASPFFRRAENRFLAERVVIDETRTVAPLRRLRALLAENRVVSITVTDTASSLHEFPLCGGMVVLPDGPVELGARMGAVILPVFTAGSRKVPVVQVGPPLPVEGVSEEAVHTCQAAAVDWLQGRIAAHPADWIGWRAGLFRNEPA